MKRIFIITLLLALAEMVHARTFEIKVLNTPSININGKELKVGNSFEETAQINWSSDKQAMKVLSDDNKIFVISKNLLTKYKAKNFSDYITSVKSATVRNDGENLPVSVEDHRAIFEGDFVLMDYITFNVGWKIDEFSFFEGMTNNLGEGNITFIMNTIDGKILISREILNILPKGCDTVSLTVRYIEKEYNDTTLITDKMNIEIVPLKY